MIPKLHPHSEQLAAYPQLKLPTISDIRLDDLEWSDIPNGCEAEKPSPVFARIEVKAAE